MKKFLLLFSCTLLVFYARSQNRTDLEDVKSGGIQVNPYTGEIKQNFGKTPGENTIIRTDLRNIPQPVDQTKQILKGDPRQLELSENGMLLSPYGYEVVFKIPNNPNDPGICATPTPYVNVDGSWMKANCPVAVPCDISTNRDANIPNPGDPIKYFKLNWTVIQNGGASSNIDQTRINDLMAELNSDFLPWRIQFCADPATFVNDATHYDLNAGTEDGTLKGTHGSNPADWINIYVVNQITNPSAGGYARFPYDPFGGTNINGGIVLARGNCFLGTHTLAHEMGHTFGLYHTFHGVDEVAACTNCYEGRDMGTGQSSTGDTEGDWCQDTPPHPTNANICSDNGTDACPPNLAWLNSPVNNHMSYSFCTSQFTSQQAGRMHCMINTYLQSWVNYGATTCAAQPPIADFSGSPTFWLAPNTVNFTDLSVPQSNITTWTWNFDVTGIGGATPSTFNGQNPPAVVFSVADTCYTVSLTVSNVNGSDTETKNMYICTASPSSGGACDTLDAFNTPANTGAFTYTYGANDYVTGWPNSFGDTRYIERYFTSGPNMSIGRLDVALGNCVNNSGNLAVRIVVYPDNPANPGTPDFGNPLGGTVTFGPDTVGVPGAGFYTWLPIEFCPAIDLGANTNFYVSVERMGGTFGGGSPDIITLMTTQGVGTTHGQALGLNQAWGPLPLFAGTFTNFLTGIGLDFDLGIIPTLGEIAPIPYLDGLFQAVGCDTTLLIYVDSFACSTPTTWDFEFSDGVQFTDTSYANVDTFAIFYYQPGPVSLTIRTTNSCGRIDSVGYNINYTFNTSPSPDFTMNMTNPICTGTSITFTGTPVGMADYTWDFGDGTVASSGASNTTTHSYASPGTYYVTLTVTDASGCTGEIQKLGFVEIIDCSVNPPLAGMNVNPVSGCAPFTTNITDNSSAAPDPATSWFWAFDDGTFSIAQNPGNHTYTNPGTYNVMLVASNAGGSDTSYFTVTVNNCPLASAVKLTANGSEDNVFLSWEDPNATGSTIYKLERSFDGRTFHQVGEMAGQAGEDYYTSVDQPGVNDLSVWYRVLVIRSNGDADYTNQVKVNFTGSDQWLSVYPNPLSGNNQLNIMVMLDQESPVHMQLYDVVGKQLLNESKKFAAGMRTLQLDLSGYEAGTYFLRMTSSKGTETIRLIVE